MNIYTITIIEIDDEYYRDIRCIGYVDSLEKAQDIVESMEPTRNSYKSFVVIEEIPDGIYPELSLEWWYGIDKQTNSYINCQKWKSWGSNRISIG